MPVYSGKHGRFASKKSKSRAEEAGFNESDFEGLGKITMVLVKKKIKPKKTKKPKKKSAYYAQYYDGTNMAIAELIGNFLTGNHSGKIKAGNRLEDDVGDDIKEHSAFNFYKEKKLDDEEIVAPCVIASCSFPKAQYEKYELKCKNKTCVEIDLVVIDSENNVSIIELKNGCDFDTKKSKGEVQSLEATKRCVKI
jgi:hypothetical protein